MEYGRLLRRQAKRILCVGNPTETRTLKCSNQRCQACSAVTASSPKLKNRQGGLTPVIYQRFFLRGSTSNTFRITRAQRLYLFFLYSELSSSVIN